MHFAEIGTTPRQQPGKRMRIRLVPRQQRLTSGCQRKPTMQSIEQRHTEAFFSSLI